MNLLLKIGLMIERKIDSREKEKQQLIRGKYMDNLALMYGLHRRAFESDAKLRERIILRITGEEKNV